MMTRPLLGLMGIIIAAMTAEFNDQVTSIALVDIRGALGISYDPGTWIQSLYVSAEIVGMAVSPWQLVTFTLRRWTLFAIALCGLSSALIPFSPNIEAIYALRVLQGYSEGLILPLLITTALRALTPQARLYGLAVYALTSTFTPAVAATLAALWTDVLVNWRFVFFQAVPLCVLAGVLVWYGDPQDEPHYERFHVLDWRGVVLLAIGFGAFSTMLYQGDRLDWFDSPLICLLAVISAVAIPLFVLNEWFHPLPLIRFQFLGRRNLGFGCAAIVIFTVIAQSSSTVPLQFLQQVQGYRPLQSNLITLEIAAAQLALLPAVAFLLDFPQVDARVVIFVGLACILTACIGVSFVDYTWNRDQFFLWQAFQAVGQPMVIMSILMMSTNSVRSPAEAPFVSALINMPRALAEALGFWLLALIARWRGAFHSNNIVDQIGLTRYSTIQGNGVLANLPPPLLPNGQPRTPDSLQALGDAVMQQVTVMTIADTFLVFGAITVFLMVVLLVLPVRTLPPRILLASNR
jgi:MFS transporter, DHA2 family, multidrug resistance protein